MNYQSKQLTVVEHVGDNYRESENLYILSMDPGTEWVY
jgi:hypothetical protein